ncbi:MAG: N-6 DNA methylase [Winogradskyella sp.]|uniref:N-6 DNA methylase n=1 Tax=Winogradskyella sp. TaxID=1883156 RepID=UPI0017B8E8DC|nr:N-6 DNA methylase [Winogradskyella sp.]MBT8244135.1 N-6 DNA methylase [Winogradskyella sp.]NNK21727.1 N-6 DNA methylase [Winogradskyella sp.]
MFYNTGIPACIWFLRRGRSANSDTKNEILFIDASEMGYMKSRVHRDFTEEDIAKVRDTYLNWRTQKETVIASEAKQSVYEDIKGFCKSATLEAIQKHSYVLTPGRYVGIPDEEDDGIQFEEKMQSLTVLLKEQMDKEQELNAEIATQLAKIGVSL